MGNATMPNDWRDEPCFLVAIPRPLVQYAGGLLKMAEMPGFWASANDYRNGYAAVTEMEACLMSACLNTLFAKQDELYRLVNTALLGVSYSVVTEVPLVVSPAITPFVNLDIHDQNSLMGRIDRLTQLIDNSVNGTATALYTYDPSIKALLQSIIDALGSEDTDLSSILAQLEIVAGLLA